jgi:hypothetical protein
VVRQERLKRGRGRCSGAGKAEMTGITHSGSHRSKRRSWVVVSWGNIERSTNGGLHIRTRSQVRGIARTLRSDVVRRRELRVLCNRRQRWSPFPTRESTHSRHEVQWAGRVVGNRHFERVITNKVHPITIQTVNRWLNKKKCASHNPLFQFLRNPMGRPS